MSTFEAVSTHLSAESKLRGLARSTRPSFHGTLGWTIREPLEVDALSESFTYVSVVTQMLEGKRVSVPIQVEVRVTVSGVSVTDLNTGIVGLGDSESEAKADFCEALIEYRDVLSTEPNLSSGLKALLAHLSAIA